MPVVSTALARRVSPNTPTRERGKRNAKVNNDNISNHLALQYTLNCRPETAFEKKMQFLSKVLWRRSTNILVLIKMHLRLE